MDPNIGTYYIKVVRNKIENTIHSFFSFLIPAQYSTFHFHKISGQLYQIDVRALNLLFE